MTLPCLFLQALPDQSAFPWLQPGISSQVQVLDQYELSQNALDNRAVLILTMHQDQRLLYRNRELLEKFVEGGGIMIIQGHVVLPFLSFLEKFRPMGRPKLSDLAITFHQPQHPVLADLNPEALNKRRGVAGFYARGSNPPPEDAEIITAIAGGKLPVDWTFRHRAGLIFTHSGNDLWTTFDDRESNIEFTRRLIDWALREKERHE